MPIPTFDEIRGPILEALADGSERRIQELMDFIAARFKLTDKEVRERRSSNGRSLLYDRVSWSCAHLRIAHFIDSPNRGTKRITDAGSAALAELQRTGGELDWQFLQTISAFTEHYDKLRRGHSKKGTRSPRGGTASEPVDGTPKERLEAAANEITGALAEELRQKMLSIPFYAFERLVVRLLTAMGYGGGREDAARVTKRSRDGGIDGIINEDELGLDTILIQAKRWDSNPVSEPDVHKFAGSAGALSGKGVIITTSHFTGDAIKWAKNNQKVRLALIDGKQLAHLMIRHGVGVSLDATYDIMKTDEDWFEALS